jgi:leucyl aminopeptidase
MNIQFTISKSEPKNTVSILLVNDEKELKDYQLPKELIDAAKTILKSGEKSIYFPSGTGAQIIVKYDTHKNLNNELENIRKAGNLAAQIIKKLKIESITIVSNKRSAEQDLALAEGLILSTYSFDKYKTNQKELFKGLKSVAFYQSKVTKEDISELSNIVKATFIARNLVNEPVNYLTAEKIAEEFVHLGKEAKFAVEILNKNKIKSLKMGGLLSVNLGSPNPPTFSIMEYKPKNAINKKPIVLVGKGVVYDTGGLSLKPTPGSMDSMKCDMAGAATVGAAIYAIALSKLPVYVVALVPATDNRPGGNAYTPGDVITMYSGKTVEVLNTDAEGRLILADALHYAKKYKPELVMDFATLTGAAARAIGKEGIVYMGTASDKYKHLATEAGNSVHERLVEFPIWEEYASQIKSDIADLKNLGGTDAGAITAGKFLQEFTDYEWLHFDIAAPAFLSAEDNYRGKNGTGVGVRLVYKFIKTYCSVSNGKKKGKK